MRKNACRYPDNKPSTAYQKGCRCERCVTHHRWYHRTHTGKEWTRDPDAPVDCLFPHLKPSTGRKYGCVCERCRPPLPEPEVKADAIPECQHPTVVAIKSYNMGCRCTRCATASRDYQRNRRLQKKAS